MLIVYKNKIEFIKNGAIIYFIKNKGANKKFLRMR